MKVLRGLWQRSRPLQIGLIIAAVFAVGFVLGNQNSISQAQSDNVQPKSAEKAFEPFWQVYNLINNNYIDRVDTSKLVDGAIKGMVDSLGDQFSGYMDAATFPMLNADLSGKIEGIGAVVETVEKTNEVRVVNVLEGSPAEKAGLKSGDIFAKVEGKDVSGLSQLDLVTKVRGPSGSTVNLTMKRGDQLIDFAIVRAEIKIANVEYRKLDGDIGYVKLRDFTPDARTQVDEALQKLDVNKLNGLVFDLRGNPGGLLTSAIDIGSAFIKDGTILIEDFGNGKKQTFTANGSYAGISVPIVVLVDKNSASASELVAGALQDRKVATIMGETTFGKGTVQTWQELVNGGGVRLTIARWLTPNGKWIHKNGITPDIKIVWPEDKRDSKDDPQLQGAIEFFKSPVKQVQPEATATPQ
jgi:carboxyl-terminal processing protease